jgi:hypothetical protein
MMRLLTNVGCRLGFSCLMAALLLPQFASAKDCGEPNWTTTVPLRATVVTLRWTGVYAGSDAVCEVTYPGTGGNSIALQVWGQPIPNATENLIAFLSCAENGCDKILVVADVAGGTVLTVPLPLSQPQVYLRAKWDGHTRRLLIADEKTEATPLLMCAVTHTIACTSTKPNQRPERP